MINNQENNIPDIPDDNEQSTLFTAPQVKTKKHRLSNTVRGLICAGACIVIAAAVAVTAIYIIPANSDDDDTSSVESQSIEMLNLKIADIKSLEVNNQEVSYLTYQVESQSESEENETVWNIKGYEKYSFPSVSYFAESISDLGAAKKYSRDLDDSAYGFDEPTCSIDITMQDGSQTQLTIGRASPDESGYYACINNGDEVYVVVDSDFNNYMSRDFRSFISMTSLAPYSDTDTSKGYVDDSGNIIAIDYLILGGSCRKDEIRVESPPADLYGLDFVTTLPNYRVCEYEKITELLEFAYSGLVNGGAYVLGYTDADLEKYGLVTPYSTFKCKIDDYSFDIKFGNLDEDGNYSCIVDGSDIIYKVAAASYSFIENDGTDVYIDSIFCEFVANMSSLDIEINNDKHQFVLDRSGNTDDQSDSVYEVVLDGKQDVTKEQFGFLYSRVISFTAEEISEQGTSGDPYITITVSYTTGRENDTLKIYKYSDRRYMIDLNDDGHYLVASSNVDDFVTNYYKLLSGIEITRP